MPVCSFSTISKMNPILYGGGKDCEISVGKQYGTFGEVFSAIKAFCQKNFYPMKILSSVVFDPNDEDYYYKTFCYTCVHYGKYVPKGKGIRQKRKEYLCKECPVRINVRLHLQPYPHYEITKVNLKHNHVVNSETYNSYSKQRLLTPEEKIFLKDILASNATNKDIRLFIEIIFGKKVTASDVGKLRSKFKNNSNNPDKCSQEEIFSINMLSEELKCYEQKSDPNASDSSDESEEVISLDDSNSINDDNKHEALSHVMIDEINYDDISFTNLDSDTFNTTKKKLKCAKHYTNKIASFLSQCYDINDFGKKLEILDVLLQIWKDKENVVLCKEENGVYKAYVGDLSCTFISENNSTVEIADDMEVTNESSDHNYTNRNGELQGVSSVLMPDMQSESIFHNFSMENKKIIIPPVEPNKARTPAELIAAPHINIDKNFQNVIISVVESNSTAEIIPPRRGRLG